MNPGFLSSQRTSRTECYWRRRSPRMTDTKNNKVLSLVQSMRCTDGLLIMDSETLIVWTEQNGTDMALSFQEAEGCAVIWFVPSAYAFLLSAPEWVDGD